MTETIHPPPGTVCTCAICCPRKYALGGSEPAETYVLALNKYQRDNLLMLINAIGWPAPTPGVPPFTLANTGDWVGEIGQMLRPEDGPGQPNMTLEQLREALR